MDFLWRGGLDIRQKQRIQEVPEMKPVDVERDLERKVFN